MSITDELLELKVLIVDDSENDTLLLVRHLKKGGFNPNYLRVESREGLRDALISEPWDIVITDHNLPGFNSSASLDVIKGYDLDIPVIIVSGTIGEEVAVTAMQGGAADYIMKDNLARLVPAINRELKEFDTRRAKQRAEQALQHMVYHDPLTNLVNRTLFRDRLEQALVRSNRSGSKVALLLVDLDRFKVTNDSLGHDMGDLLLKEISRRLIEVARQEDTVARFGGDEFMIIIEGCSDETEAGTYAQQILDKISAPVNLLGNEIFISASIGIALSSSNLTSEAVIKHAAIAMDRAKEKGKNIFQYYSPEMNAKARVRMTLESGLHHALERNELKLYYQPQIDTRTNQLAGAEALLRWKHPKIGMIPPGEFIGLLEETGLIISVGKWVIETACSQWQAWRKAGIVSQDTAISVNISSYQFKSVSLLEDVANALANSGLSPECLELEITESTLMEDTVVCQKLLKQLKNMGVRIAIDDFGTGYSSLSYLKKFPIDCLKIDQSFVKDVASDADDAAIATAIIGLAHNLRLTVIAEGVESKEIVDFLKQRHCDLHQGFYFSLPLPAEKFGSVVQGNTIARAS